MKVEKPKPGQKLPPLPSAFYDLYTSKPASQLENETDKNGKVRVAPHVEGQWPTHVYLEWKPDVAWRRLEILNGSVSKALETQKIAYHSLVKSEVGVRLPLHVSLSDTLLPSTESKQQVIDGICDALKAWEGPVKIELAKTKLQVVFNKTKTRGFVVLALENAQRVVRLIETVNAVVVGLGLPALTPHPHLSIGWFVPTKSTDPDAIVSDADCQRHWTALCGKVALDSVKVKCGRLVQSVDCR